MDINSEPASSDLVCVDDTTIFVLGNGPSLKGVDLDRLSNYPTIGLNAAYRHWRNIDWRPTFYACLDEEVGLSHRDEIAALISEGRIQTFLLRANLIEALGPLAANPRVVNFEALRSSTPLLDPPAITTGSHAALWAAAMGYRKIVIAGVDGRYVEIVPGAERRGGMALEIVRESENPNYFFDGYQRAGDRFNIPNPRPNVHLGAWNDAAVKLAEAGTEIYNASPKSAVGFFPFIDLDKALTGGSEISPRTAIAVAPSRPVGTEEETGEPGTPRARLGIFLKRHSAGLAAGAVLLALIWGLAALALDFQLAGTIAATLGLGFAYGLYVLLIYTRFVVARELDALRRKLENARARIKDLERL